MYVGAKFFVSEGVANGAGEGGVVFVGVGSVGKEVPHFTGPGVDEELEEVEDRVSHAPILNMWVMCGMSCLMVLVR